MAKAKERGGILTPDPSRVLAVPSGALAEDLPGGLVIGTTPFARNASDVFSAAEMAERIARYTERAALRLPLTPRRGDPEGERAGRPEPPRSQCFACGEAPESGGDLYHNWHTRRLTTGGNTENYCPTCFDAFGWGEGDHER